MKFESEEKQYEYIEQYVLGKLSKKEVLSFEEAMRKDEQLAREVEAHQIAIKAVKASAMMQAVKLAHREAMAGIQTKSKFTLLQTRWFQVAAALVLLVGGSLLWQLLTVNANHALGKWETYAIVTRGNTAEAIENAYSIKDFSTVARLYESASAKNQANSFMAGNAYLKLGEPAKALACFQEVKQLNQVTNEGLYADQADWYMALAFLQLDQPGAAKEIFTEIRADQQHSYFEEATLWRYWRLQLLTWKN